MARRDKRCSTQQSKIGGGNVNFYCMKHIGINIGGGKSNNWNERSILSNVDVERIYELYTKFYNQQNTFQKADYPIVPKPEFVKTFNTQTNNFKTKYMCMLFLETFIRVHQNKEIKW